MGITPRGRSLPPALPLCVPRPLEPLSPRAGTLLAATLILDLDLVEGRSGAVRLPPGRFAFVFEGFFWVDLATVLLVFLPPLASAAPAAQEDAAGRVKRSASLSA